MSTREVSVQRSTALADDVVAALNAQLKAAYDAAMTKARTEVAEPRYWWNVYAFGPIQLGAHDTTDPGGFTGPLLPNQVIRASDPGPAFVASIIILNPFVLPNGVPPTPSQILQTFGLPYTVDFQIANLTTWAAAGTLASGGSFVPGGPGFYVNVVPLPAQPAGMYEINVTARILGAGGITAPPFAGFARYVLDIDDELFSPAPGWQFDLPIRYQVYT